MPELIIREMTQDEDFAHWLAELVQLEDDGAPSPAALVEDHWLGLTNEIGDWIGGLRYYTRGGVAHLLDIVVAREHRNQGYAHQLLKAFEERSADAGAHLAEFWTDDERAEGLLAALGWRRVMRRDRYIGERGWSLMEKRLAAAR